MIFRKTWFFAAAIGAGFLSSPTRAAEAPGALSYATSCAIVDAGTVDGYVTNKGQGEAYLVLGEVQFIFTSEDSMSRPAIVFTANSVVPAGQNVRVAHVKLAFEPLPGETCRFEVKDAIRKAR
jgi:hypothetical protein